MVIVVIFCSAEQITAQLYNSNASFSSTKIKIKRGNGWGGFHLRNFSGDIFLGGDYRFQINELNEFFANDTIISVSSDSSAIQKLLNNEINLAIISINSSFDLGLVKYINDNFKKIKVVLSIQKEMQAAFSVFTSGNYMAIQNPLKLKELKNVLKKN